jgi:hypothetical protein
MPARGVGHRRRVSVRAGQVNTAGLGRGVGRNISGVHWRWDYEQSLRLREKVAIATLAEDFNGDRSARAEVQRSTSTVTPSAGSLSRARMLWVTSVSSCSRTAAATSAS